MSQRDHIINHKPLISRGFFVFIPNASPTSQILPINLSSRSSSDSVLTITKGSIYWCSIVFIELLLGRTNKSKRSSTLNFSAGSNWLKSSCRFSEFFSMKACINDLSSDVLLFGTPFGRPFGLLVLEIMSVNVCCFLEESAQVQIFIST